MTHNALAEPGILGVNAGASLAIVIAVGTFGVNGFGGYVWFAFGGAVLATGAVYLVGMAGARSSDPGAAGACRRGAGRRAFRDRHGPGAGPPGGVRPIAGLDHRLARGALARTCWPPLALAVLAGVVLAAFTGRSLNALALGDDTALALGYKVGGHAC